jgi:hypothetical protein
MIAGQVLADGLTLFGIGFPGQGGPEEEKPQDGEQDEKLQDDKPDERAAPGLVSETIPVKMPYSFE